MFEPAPPDADPEPDPQVAAWGTTAERPPFARPAGEPGNGLATTSLVLGMLGLVIVFPTLGLGFFLSLPCSIGAWVTGQLARNQVAKGLTKAGDGIAHAGIILGIVGIVVAVVGAVVWAVLIASGVDLEELRRELERGR
jgi:hypothetical protein